MTKETKTASNPYGANLSGADHDYQDFRRYLRQCTDNQVRGVYKKERDAGRDDYQRLAEIEAARRGIDLE